MLADAENKTALEQAMHARGTGKEGRHEDIVKLLEAALRSHAGGGGDKSDLAGGWGAAEETHSDPPDEEEALKYGSRMLPLLVRAYEGAVLPPLRKGALTVVSRLVSLCSPQLLERLASKTADDSLPMMASPSPIVCAQTTPGKSPSRVRKAQSYRAREFSQVLVDFIATILASEEDEGLLMLALGIVRDSTIKAPTCVFPRMLRQGVVSHVETLASDPQHNWELSNLAQNICTRVFLKHNNTPSGVVADLQAATEALATFFLPGVNGLVPSLDEQRKALSDVAEFLQTEDTVSPFELEKAGVVDALLVFLLSRYSPPFDTCFANIFPESRGYILF